MSAPGTLLQPNLFKDLIQRFRMGVPLFFVCNKNTEDFTLGEAYSVERIASGSGFVVTNDEGGAVMIDEFFEQTSSFVFTSDHDEAAAIGMQLKGEAVTRLAVGIMHLSRKEDFEVGDVISWKENCRISKFPGEKQPAVVIEVLETPLLVESVHPLDPGSTLKCDLVIGFEGLDGYIVTTHADSRRFQKHFVQIANMADQINVGKNSGE